MVVEFILAHVKVCVFFVPIVECKYSIIIEIICYSELTRDVPQCQNFGDGFLIKPYLTMPFYNIFVFSIDGSTLSLNFCGIIYFSDYCCKILVAEEVRSVFIVEK